VDRLVWALYLAAVALVPWAWWPPFPWLHPRAQWSDAVFAAAALAWALQLWRERRRPRAHPAFAAMAAYLAWAALSLLANGVTAPGAAKLLGHALLVAIAVVSADLASRRGGFARLARAVAATSLATAAAALLGERLFLAGWPTRLVGTYGDLVPGAYARAEAGFTHPNLLASFCLAAAGLVASRAARLPGRWRRFTQAALAVTVLLTVSRAALAFAAAWLLREARTPGARRRAWVAVAATAALFVALSLTHLRLDPTRPGQARFDPRPSPRRQALAAAAATLAERPLFGVGPGSTPARADGVPFDAHATPLNVAATLGLPAAAAFLAIPLLLWRRRARPTDLALWAALVALALDGLAQDVEDFRHVWLLFGALAAAPREAGEVPGEGLAANVRARTSDLDSTESGT
jgi:hypothetical protein